VNNNLCPSSYPHARHRSQDLRIIFTVLNTETGEKLATYESAYGAIKTYSEMIMPQFPRLNQRGITITKTGERITKVNFAADARIIPNCKNKVCTITTKEGKANPNKNTVIWEAFIMKVLLPTL